MSDNQHPHTEPTRVQHGNQPAENPDVQHGNQPPAESTVNVDPNGSITAQSQPAPDDDDDDADDDGGGDGDLDDDAPTTRRKR